MLIDNKFFLGQKVWIHEKNDVVEYIVESMHIKAHQYVDREPEVYIEYIIVTPTGGKKIEERELANLDILPALHGKKIPDSDKRR